VEGGGGGEQGLREEMGERKSVKVEEIIPMVLPTVWFVIYLKREECDEMVVLEVLRPEG